MVWLNEAYTVVKGFETIGFKHHMKGFWHFRKGARSSLPRMYVCLSVSLSVCKYVGMYVCMYVWMCECVYACAHLCRVRRWLGGGTGRPWYPHIRYPNLSRNLPYRKSSIYLFKYIRPRIYHQQPFCKDLNMKVPAKSPYHCLIISYLQCLSDLRRSLLPSSPDPLLRRARPQIPTQVRI